MPPPFRQLTRAQFAQLVREFNFTRRIVSVHFHHTTSPNHAQWRGHDSVVGMFRHHTQVRGFSDIAQHLTIAPDGTVFLGRNWNRAPASAAGRDTNGVPHNGGSAAGPFMFETVGNFNTGRDPFRDPQTATVIAVIAAVQLRAGLPPAALRFHREMSSTDCPGTALTKSRIIELVTELHGDGGLESLLADTERGAEEEFDAAAVAREFEESATRGAESEEEIVEQEDTHEEVPEETPEP